MEESRRNRDTSAATYERRMRKWRRWAAEMRENGWNIPADAEPVRDNREGK